MTESSATGPARPHLPARWQKRTDWRSGASKPKPYNPLDLENLGRSVEIALLTHDPEPLGSVNLMIGAGAYALYYTGQLELYATISSPDCDTPIYVGQARPEGTRKGASDPTRDSSPLWDRLRDHVQTIDETLDLDLSDFKVRYLVVLEAFVSLAERVMIKDYRPVWNVAVDGFGNHDPGVGRRRTGRRPPWDELHPGRWWSHPLNMPTESSVSAAESRRRVGAHFRGDPAQLESELIAQVDDE